MEQPSIKVQDRLYVDKNKIDKIRELKKSNYLTFDTHKEIFLLAMALGASEYRGGELSEGKEGLLNLKDLNEFDKALMRSLIYGYFKNLDNFSDDDYIYKKAEGMADKGFEILLKDVEESSSEIFLLKTLNKTNELFKEAQEKKLFEIE